MPISVMPAAVVDVPMVGILRSLDRADGEHLVGQRRADDQHDLVASDQFARRVDGLVLVPRAVFHRQGDLLAAEHALLVDLIQRQFESGLDGDAIGRGGAVEDFDRAHRHIGQSRGR